jgi:hypothetical protein
MADLQFSRQEIADLAQKLTTIASDLSERETSLLVAIFAAAADRATPAGPGGGATLPRYEIRIWPGEAGYEEGVNLLDLKQELLNAFIPGNDFNFFVTGKVVGPPPPKVVGPPPGMGENRE